MKITINRQESNSRGQLLLRSFFGWIYIFIPHLFVLMFVSIWYGILDFIKFWVVLFTGRIPESTYEFQKKFLQWEIRLSATMMNMRDGYPAIGIRGSDPDATIEYENPESVSRGLVLVRALFGWVYVGIPHGFLLWFYGIAVSIVQFLAWWAILFTGKYPDSMFDFIMKYLRWSMRVSLYLSYYSDEYPPFNGEE
jgi:hypothetical protein